MKIKLLLFSTILLLSTSAFSKKVIIVSQISQTFSPDSVSIIVGDTIVFSGNSNHPIIEVSQATWNAFSSTSNGGFSFPSGSGTFVPQNAQVYYYVCSNHVGSGMRGRIFVGTTSGIAADPNLSFVSTFNVYPNPAHGFINISYKMPVTSQVSVSVFNLLGKEVLSVFRGVEQAGIYEKQFQLSDNLNAGIYFVKVRAGSKESITKLIIQ